MRRVKAARDAMSWGESGPPPLVVKIAPDLTEDDKKDIAAVVAQTAIDGLVVSNTTIERPGPVAEHPNGGETGGLSGESPLASGGSGLPGGVPGGARI